MIQGEAVTLHPYERGVWPKDAMHTLWAKIDAAGDIGKLIWDGDGWHDLAEFVLFLHDRDDPKHVLCVMDNETHDVCGVIWFYHIGDREAYGTFWFDPSVRGTLGVHEATWLATHYAFENHIDTLKGMTGSMAAVNLLRKHGWEHVASVPPFFKADNKEQVTHLVRLHKKEHIPWVEVKESLQRSRKAPAMSNKRGS